MKHFISYYRSILLSQVSSHILIFLIVYSIIFYYITQYLFHNANATNPTSTTVTGFVGYPDWRVEAEYMDKLGLKANTLKASMHHNFTRVYPKFFAPIRHKALKFLEFGLFKGDSVKMWEWYFPNAELHFVDITDAKVEYRSQRSQYHIFHQSDVEKLTKLGMESGPFDIIIDDASHVNADMIRSFTTLFPYLRPGGIYVFEDFHATYHWGYGGYGNYTHVGKSPGVVQFVKDLVDEVQLLGATSFEHWANPYNVTSDTLSRLTYYARRIDSLHFYPGLAFIQTREETLGN